MSLYIDTSCLLKLWFPEPEGARVREVVASEEHVVVSTLARLEAFVQLHARCAGGSLSTRDARALMRRLDSMLARSPWEVVRTPSEIIDLAEERVRMLAKRAYCATLDGLHLEIMDVLGLKRLLTNDDTQAAAARHRGFDVTLPR